VPEVQDVASAAQLREHLRRGELLFAEESCAAPGPAAKAGAQTQNNAASRKAVLTGFIGTLRRLYVGQNGLTCDNENGYHLYMYSNSAENRETRSGTCTPAVPDGRVVSGQLLGDRGELVIEHNGRDYRLRLTQSGKLILTA